ncbi:Gfo/Idh/MocA family protein [Paenibacillus oceani]|uniref:Gfo/Idh/MocA family oxidoreductase n=1 Tax=Paenibacillus oceani TaxID=2772510 RepID=A0A927GYV9_9BACL|nr:Gfo/Idh/MocA family oxidoreductase [Paenibacillus oceani]MBD2862321.1 Gfo/Idh/MocA family oxidoreductase [Paenibacillus oceani]
MNKIRVGIIGTGAIFRLGHAPGWTSHSHVELVAFCDPREDEAKRLAQQYGVTKVYSDYRVMLEQEKLDAVGVATPNKYHAEISIYALNKGLHVFCEKPDAMTPEEAQQMADAAALSGNLLMIMRNNRFMPTSRFLKRYIETGHMGDIYTGRVGWIRRRGIPGRGGWFTTKSLSGGGPLIDLGVHMIDLAVWLMGNPSPVAVSGATYTKFADNKVAASKDSSFGVACENGIFDVEDLATGFIRFDNGATLQIEFSWASNIEDDLKFLELRGTKSGCRLEGRDLKLMTEIEEVLCDITPRLENGGKEHTKNIHHFVECLLGNASPIMVPGDGVDIIKILNAIYLSAETGEEVKLQQ